MDVFTSHRFPLTGRISVWLSSYQYDTSMYTHVVRSIITLILFDLSSHVIWVILSDAEKYPMIGDSDGLRRFIAAILVLISDSV